MPFPLRSCARWTRPHRGSTSRRPFRPQVGWLGHCVALSITYVAAILCAFVLYRKLVLRVRGHLLRDLRRFSSVYISTFLLNLVMLTVLVKWLGFTAVISQLLLVSTSIPGDE